MAAPVLVVDDDPSKRIAVQAMLAPLGYRVVEADSGNAALRAVLDQDFAVILMDVRMPALSGYETAKLIRRRQLTPIIFVTAFGRDDTETATAYASGAVDFVFTPIDANVLRAKVSAFVDLFAHAEELRRSVESVTALNAALRDSEARARAVLENVADGIVTASEDGVIESFNGSAQKLFGYGEKELIGKPLTLLIAPGEDQDVSAGSTETTGSRKDGSSFSMELDITEVRIGERTCTIGCMRDISGRKAYTEALEYRTLHDPLTGLPNRALFSDRLDHAIAVADRSGGHCGVLLVSLNGFAEINETLGRAEGDALLQEVAGRLRGALRDSETVGRVDGDQFAILPSGDADLEVTTSLAWKLRETLVKPFASGAVRASMGMAFFPQHGRGTTELLRRAGLAAREAKRSGEGLAVFVAEPEDETALRLTLLSELRDGIGRDELVLHYQPKLDLIGQRRVTGVEALVRWAHPTRGLLMPDDFMPEAERSELIEPLTHWVLGKALRQQRLWSDAGLDLTMAVNISARSLGRHSELPDALVAIAETRGISLDRIVLELTERAIVDADVPDTLHVLHAMGTVLSIDDFGTGHSSLVYLQQLPIDQIKVDRSFVMKLATAPSDAVIVRSTIDLAHNLGMTVVAEGVEDETSLNMLVEYGCDCAQGYYFSRPRAAEDLTPLLLAPPGSLQAAPR